MTVTPPYNPLDKGNLGKSVADALLRAPCLPLKNIKSIEGAGVYAIYYCGDFADYAPIARRNINCEYQQPIYVGKAVPNGARRGGGVRDAAVGKALQRRLQTHATSINEVDNLLIDDFFFRFLTVDDVWIPLGENVLIEIFQPLWNRVIDGFGNKTPGKRRKDQLRSQWDMIHPGRSYVTRLQLPENALSAPAIRGRIADFFEGRLGEDEKISDDVDDLVELI